MAVLTVESIASGIGKDIVVVVAAVVVSVLVVVVAALGDNIVGIVYIHCN